MKSFTFCKQTSNLLGHLTANYDVALDGELAYTKVVRGFLRVEHHLLPAGATTPLWVAVQPIMHMGFTVVEGKYMDVFSSSEKHVPEYAVERTSWWKYQFKTSYGGMDLVWERPLWSWSDEIVAKHEHTGQVVLTLKREMWSLWNKGTIDMDDHLYVPVREKGMPQEMEGFLVLVALTLLDIWQRQQHAHH